MLALYVERPSKIPSDVVMAQEKPVGQPDNEISEIPITEDMQFSPQDAAEFKALYDWHEASQKSSWVVQNTLR